MNGIDSWPAWNLRALGYIGNNNAIGDPTSNLPGLWGTTGFIGPGASYVGTATDATNQPVGYYAAWTYMYDLVAADLMTGLANSAPWTNNDAYVLKLGSISHSGDFLLLTEAVGYSDGSVAEAFKPSFFGYDGTILLSHGSTTDITNAWANVLLADGHVESASPARIAQIGYQMFKTQPLQDTYDFKASGSISYTSFYTQNGVQVSVPWP